MAKREHENFMQRNLHAITSLVFLSIVVLDLLIMPLWNQYNNTRISVVQMVQLASTFKDGPTQLEALKVLHDQTNYVSMTLSTVGGSMFYTCFAAILGIGAWSRGKENIAESLSNGTGSGAAGAVAVVTS
jgi:hypothetical protein